MSPAADPVSLAFAALSDPTRRAMLARLLQGEATVNELAAPFRMSLPAISKHIKVLEKAGLLTKSRQAQLRPCRINGEQFRQAMDWIEQYRPLWEGRLDQPDATRQERHAAQSAAKPAQDMASNPDAIKPRSSKPSSSKPRSIKPGDTPDKAKPSAEKQGRSPSVSGPEKPRRTARKPSSARDKTDDNAPQQQTGFDF